MFGILFFHYTLFVRLFTDTSSRTPHFYVISCFGNNSLKYVFRKLIRSDLGGNTVAFQNSFENGFATDLNLLSIPNLYTHLISNTYRSIKVLFSQKSLQRVAMTWMLSGAFPLSNLNKLLMTAR